MTCICLLPGTDSWDPPGKVSTPHIVVNPDTRDIFYAVRIDIPAGSEGQEASTSGEKAAEGPSMPSGNQAQTDGPGRNRSRRRRIQMHEFELVSAPQEGVSERVEARGDGAEVGARRIGDGDGGVYTGSRRISGPADENRVASSLKAGGEGDASCRV